MKGKKTGGRTLGTPNKKTLALSDKCQALGLDVWDTLAKMALDESEDKALRVGILKELAQYLYPKRKAMELTDKSKRQMTFERFDGTKETYTLGPVDGDDGE